MQQAPKCKWEMDFKKFIIIIYQYITWFIVHAFLYSFSESVIKRLMNKGIEDDTTVVNVSVAIWFTKEFAEVEDDIQG